MTVKRKNKMTKTINNIYSIYDTEAELYSPLYEAVNDKVAVRSFKDNILSKNSEMADVINLVRLGSVDRESGLIISCKPLTVAKGATITIQEQING